jgi:AcrR family transcriptional regulator
MSSQPTRARLSAEDWITGGLQLLADEGLAGVKVDALAGRLGVTKGSFYWHFESLPAFLVAMVDYYCAWREAGIQAFPDAAPPDPLKRLAFLMEEISDPATWNLERAIRAWAYSNPRLQRHVAAADVWGFGEVRSCFEALGFTGVDAEIRAKTLYYAGIGFLHTGSLGAPERAAHRTGLLKVLTRT